jgi:HEAT repeat protein
MTLRALQSDRGLAVQARYGLGSHAFKLRDKDPELSRLIVAELIDELDRTPSESRRETLLTALGNAGLPDAIPALRKALADPSAPVRAAAAQGLRRIPGEEADQLLAVAISDPSVSVRLHAVDAISERRPSQVLVTVLQTIATHEPHPRVRAIAVSTAGEWMRQFQHLSAVLHTVASTDENEDVRRIARNALDRIQTGG